MKLFLDRGSAIKFSQDFSAQQQKEIFETLGGRPAAVDDAGDQDISIDAEAVKSQKNNLQASLSTTDKPDTIQRTRMSQIDEAEFVRAPKPRILPHEEGHRGARRNYGQLMNCMSFCMAERINQDDMLEEDMGIDTRHLMRTPILQKDGLDQE